LNRLLQITYGYMQPYRIFKSGVKPKARKMRLRKNKKSEFIGPDSPLKVWIAYRYPKSILSSYRLIHGDTRCECDLVKNGISQKISGFEKLLLVGIAGFSKG